MSNGWGRRERTVYAYDVRNPRAPHWSPPVVGYVGKTSSALYYRARQHESKPWAKYVTRGPYPVWQGRCGRISLWLREVYWILRLRPLFNVEWNRCNPDRIPPREVQRMRRRHW